MIICDHLYRGVGEMVLGGFARSLKFVVQLSLVGVLSNSAFANEDASPVQIYDIQKWIQIRDGAARAPQVVAVKQLIEIIYDKIISRPWEEAPYWAEAEKRWTNYRQTYCPSAQSLCALPEKLETVQQLGNIRNELVKPQTRDMINTELAKVGLKLSPNLIFPVQLPVAENDKSNFSFRITTIESEGISNVEDKSLVRMGDVVMYDIFTYRMNYTQDIARTYFAVDSQGHGYVQADRVREAAYTLAKQWKMLDARLIEYNALNATELLLQKLKLELKPEFEATYARLLAKLDPKNVEHVQHIHRFESERARDRYPSEVFQWVAFDQLMSVAEVLTEQYQDAKLNRRDLHAPTTSLQSVAKLQAQTAPRLLYYLLQREWDLDEGGVIEQIVTKPLAGMYLVEHLNVLLERGPYESAGMFAELAPAIDYKLLLAEPEFLKTHHPAFHARMSSLGMLDPEKVKAAPLAIQKAWLEEYLTKDEKPFILGAYRVSAALSLGVNARQSRDMSEAIRKARLLLVAGEHST